MTICETYTTYCIRTNFPRNIIYVFRELVRIFVILSLRSPLLSEDVANHVCYHCSNHTVVCLTIVTSEKQPTLS